MFEDRRCPMSEALVKKYNLSEEFIKKFCSYGCSVECGKFLKELLIRKGILKAEKE